MRGFPHWVRLVLVGVSIGHLFIERSEAQTPAPAPAPLSPLQVLAVEGPNASHWVVAPLEQPLPPDIRQNLTFLREDLADEAKARPIGAPAAYNAAYRLCAGLIAALDERDLALAHAGLRNAQANNNQNLTSQSLEARRNYMTSWPQYAREQDERSEIERHSKDSVNVTKERLKVDWAERAVVLAKNFDTVYSQLREALRQTPELLLAPMSKSALTLNNRPPAPLPSEDSPLTDSLKPSGAPGPNLLKNGTFEHGIAGWQLFAFSKKAKMAADSKELHDGRHSLRIDNMGGDHTFVSQKVTVKPHTHYRLSGYIQTKGVKSTKVDATDGARLMVDNRLRSPLVTESEPWTEVTLDFTTGDENVVQIGASMGYFSDFITGTAWFSDLSLTESEQNGKK